VVKEIRRGELMGHMGLMDLSTEYAHPSHMLIGPRFQKVQLRPTLIISFDPNVAGVISCTHIPEPEVPQFFQIYVQVPRIKAGRIGKRVRIPRGRATVNDFTAAGEAKSQETCPDVAAAFERPRKVFRPQWEFPFEKRSRARLSLIARQMR
jgi:hypothetical protein